jgi:hypothetical protein
MNYLCIIISSKYLVFKFFKKLKSTFFIFKRVKDLNLNLTAINLAHCKINQIDTFQSLKQCFIHMTDLDLEYNLISTWDDIFKLLNGLDCIKTLNVR